MSELTPEKVNELLRGFFLRALDVYDDVPVNAEAPQEDRFLDLMIESAKIIGAERQRELARCDYSKIEPHVDSLLDAHGVQIEKDSAIYRNICREMLKFNVQLWQIEEARRKGDYQFEEDIIKQWVPPSRPSPNADAENREEKATR